MALTPKQQRFCQEYLIDLNATQAAIRTGYSAKTAQEQGSRLLSNVMVSAEIERRQGERSERTMADADEVVKRLAGVALFDMRKLFRPNGSPKPPHEWDADTAAAVAVVDTRERGGRRTHRVKLVDRLKALELLGKHLGLFKERVNVEVTGKGGGSVQLTNWTDEDLDAEIERLQNV